MAIDQSACADYKVKMPDCDIHRQKAGTKFNRHSKNGAEIK